MDLGDFYRGMYARTCTTPETTATSATAAATAEPEPSEEPPEHPEQRALLADEKAPCPSHEFALRTRILGEYGHETLRDAGPLEILADRADMSDAEAVGILRTAIKEHENDPNFPRETLRLFKKLVRGPSSFAPDPEWSNEVKAQAAMIQFHSPYAEVRAVTDPVDDPHIPVETLRVYILGMLAMGGVTALNTVMDAMSNYLRLSTVFATSNPGLSIGTTVMQLVLAPCGHFLAWVLPDWGFTIHGRRISLNPGPWTVKEQTLATVMFSVVQGAASTYYVYLVQRLPKYYNQSWVSWGYEITLALSVQFLGFGFAGLLRRVAIYPTTMLWPSVLPTLALNRVLCQPGKDKGDAPLNGWRISQKVFFLIVFTCMFIWWWIPNVVFRALRTFNWMTWISPQNVALAVVTGSYGGLGFNPIATFEWSQSGTGALITPWFSEIQQYASRVLSGLIIIALYWTNYKWSAYLPVNSFEAFSNTGEHYNVTRIITDDRIDKSKYKEYGPAYFSASNVFSQGAWFAWYGMVVFSVAIKHWPLLRKCGSGLWDELCRRSTLYGDYDDAQTRQIRIWPEVPEWWFLVVLVGAAGLGIAAVAAWPATAPWWTVLAVIGVSIVFVVPSQILSAVANTAVPTNVLFRMIGGVWFAGRPEAMLLTTVFGAAFNDGASGYVMNQKMALYAKLPPRAVFRAQLVAVLLQCFVFVGLLHWMVHKYDGGNLCNNLKSHYICTDTAQLYSNSIMYGGLGVPNLFKLYPVLPWCFLMGATVGIAYGLIYRAWPAMQRWAEDNFSVKAYHRLYTTCARLSWMQWFDPAVSWAGALNWTGGNNLTHSTNKVVLSFIFMYHIKRKFPGWWGRYNYILEAALDAGAACAAIIVTMVFDFAVEKRFKWWGNTVSQAGVDWQLWNGNASLLPIPDKGYFGLSPDRYPMDF